MTSADTIASKSFTFGSLPVGRQVAGLVFDLDGTLYLQGPVRRAMFFRLLRAGVTRPMCTWQEWRLIHHYRNAQEHLRGSSEPLAMEQLRLACNWSGMPPERATKVIAHWMEEAPLDSMSRNLRPGIVGLLESAKSKGIRLGVLSDYPVAGKLIAMQLNTFFSAVLSAQDTRVGFFKPIPNGLIAILADLGADTNRVVYIGDRASVDGETAKRAGVPCVILGEPFGRAGQGWIGVPDVKTLRELLEI